MDTMAIGECSPTHIWMAVAEPCARPAAPTDHITTPTPADLRVLPARAPCAPLQPAEKKPCAAVALHSTTQRALLWESLGPRSDA